MGESFSNLSEKVSWKSENICATQEGGGGVSSYDGKKYVMHCIWVLDALVIQMNFLLEGLLNMLILNICAI